MRLFSWTTVATVVLWGTGLAPSVPALSQSAEQVAQAGAPAKCPPGSTDPACTGSGSGVPGTGAVGTGGRATGTPGTAAGGAPGAGGPGGGEQPIKR